MFDALTKCFYPLPHLSQSESHTHHVPLLKFWHTLITYSTGHMSQSLSVAHRHFRFSIKWDNFVSSLILHYNYLTCLFWHMCLITAEPPLLHAVRVTLTVKWKICSTYSSLVFFSSGAPPGFLFIYFTYLQGTGNCLCYARSIIGRLQCELVGVLHHTRETSWHLACCTASVLA